MSATVAALTAGHGQGLRQVGELGLAFLLSSLIGLERQIRGKSAGLRTQAIVGMASALIVLVSKYGFADVLATGQVVLDPSRVAAQIVSGVGFIGAGLIITRQGAIRGLTTAAAVWETAAIGMAAGAGLPLLAIVVTALHFIIVLGYTALLAHLPGAAVTQQLLVAYRDRQGVLRRLLSECAQHRWSVVGLTTLESPDVAALPIASPTPDDGSPPTVHVTLTLVGQDARDAVGVLTEVDGVLSVQRLDADDRE
jgi:putative Mg2+ transporter-C (MgtC) family protein